MAQLQGHPEERALNQLLLRSMMQAVYTASDVGHYGLAAEYYLHFTSPIRRYPDLLVHRLLKAHWARNGQERSPGQLEREEQRLEDMASQSSERERAAMQVEREVVSYYAALMMKDRLGEEFAATVAGLVEFGFFVELDEVHVEGLVRADSLGIGTRFDKNLHSFTLPGGFRVRVGQKARVRLVNVNLALRRIEFEALEVAGRAITAVQETGREEREAQKQQAWQERKKANRAGRERAREERWGRPPERTERSMAEAEALRKREAEEARRAAEAVETPAVAPRAEERRPEAPEAQERADAHVPTVADRIRALAAQGAPGRAEPVQAVPPTRRKKAAAAAEEKPARAKRAAAGARKKTAARPAVKKAAAGGAGAKKKATAAKKAPAVKKAATAKKAPAAKKAAAKKTARAPVAKKAPAAKKQAPAVKARAASKARPAGGAKAKGAAKKAAPSRKAKKK
jgi:ribonuclease R